MRRSVVAISSLVLLFSGISFAPAQANGGSCTTGSFVVTGTVVTGRGDCAGVATVPSGVTAIGNGAFDGATSITSITLPASVQTIGTTAFANTTSLIAVNFEAGSQLTSIASYAFTGATALTSIELPDSVTTLGDEAFYNNASLTSVRLSDGLTHIGVAAFMYSASLVTVEFPANLISIGNLAFLGSSSLTNVVLPASLVSIGDYAFQNASGLTSIVLPESLTSIGEGAFSGTSLLTSVRIPSGVTIIRAYTFEYSGVQSVEMPEGVFLIEESAFKDSRLTSVIIPSTVTTIGRNAFYDSDLTSVYFLGSQPGFIGTWAFESIGPPASIGSGYVKASANGFATAGDPPLWNGMTISVGVYEATYNSNGGSAVSTSNFIRSGSIASAPTAPTRSGHTFAGWSATDGGSAVTFPYSPGVNSNITLFAKWTSNTAPTESSPSASSSAAVATKSTANLGKSIRFSTSSKVLTSTHKNSLKKSVTASGKDATYVVTGTAGFLPGVTEAQVKKLAKVRANIVKAYLVKLGVNKANISIKIKTTNQGIVPKTKTLASFLTS
jgi:uncharacterized repeat protein (TIGR02543 family)